MAYVAWVFDVGPESEIQQTSSRLPWLEATFCFGALVLMSYAGWTMWQSGKVDPGSENPTESDAQQIAARPAIAVLPFVNLSSDPDQEFFSDGIAIDILHQLAKRSTLAVRPRSSSFALKGRALTLEETGKLLRVTHLLEGSVRRVGDRVRITTELISIAQNQPIWSDQYDRELDHLFDVQDDITQRVLVALDERLEGEREDRSFSSKEAYLAFQRGRHLLGFYRIPAALEWLKTATDLDPSNADAWALRAETLFINSFLGNAPFSAAVSEEIQGFLSLALAIDSEHANALAIQASTNFVRDPQLMISELVEIVRDNPTDESSHYLLGTVLAMVGKQKDSIRVLNKTIELAPLSRSPLYGQMSFLIAFGLIDQAREALDSYGELGLPKPWDPIIQLAILDEDYEKLSQLAVGYPDAFFEQWIEALIPYLHQDDAKTLELTTKMKLSSGYRSNWHKHRIALLERDVEAALEYNQRALEEGEWAAYLRAGYRHHVYASLFSEYYTDPRYDQMLARFGRDTETLMKIQVPKLPF
ncbi:MAG: TolB-like protein [Candidatus Azotimanducaceae bacterium]